MYGNVHCERDIAIARLFTVNGIISFLISLIGTSVPATPNKLAIAIYTIMFDSVYVPKQKRKVGIEYRIRGIRIKIRLSSLNSNIETILAAQFEIVPPPVG